MQPYSGLPSINPAEYSIFHIQWIDIINSSLIDQLIQISQQFKYNLMEFTNKKMVALYLGILIKAVDKYFRLQIISMEVRLLLRLIYNKLIKMLWIFQHAISGIFIITTNRDFLGYVYRIKVQSLSYTLELMHFSADINAHNQILSLPHLKDVL